MNDDEKIQLWRDQLQYPDWYVRLSKELASFRDNRSKEEKKQYKKSIYILIEEYLKKNKIPLALDGPDFDIQRKSITSLVIHHTGENSNIRVSLLSAMGFLRQYALDYLDQNLFGYSLYRHAIWSGHFMHSQMVFYPYHWLIRRNGMSIRLLEDRYIGWHAGNWHINKKSIAIVLDGNYEKLYPTKEQITAIKNIIYERYSHIKNNILMHSQLNSGTVCPGKYCVSLLQELSNI